MGQGAGQGNFLRIPACDPLNLVGILTAGPGVSGILGNRIIFRDGVPVAPVESSEARLLARIEDSEQPTLEGLLDERPASAFEAGRFTRAPRRRRGRSVLYSLASYLWQLCRKLVILCLDGPPVIAAVVPLHECFRPLHSHLWIERRRGRKVRMADTRIPDVCRIHFSECPCP